MKKIIATIIRAIMPNEVRKHKNKCIHNANVMQSLLDHEHELRDMVDNDCNQVFTTKYALRYGNSQRFFTYSSYRALRNADFR
jgi:hypothetical protein